MRTRGLSWAHPAVFLGITWLFGTAPFAMGDFLVAAPPTGGYAVFDPLEDVFESPSWDITSVEFRPSKTPLIVHLFTAGPFDRNGGETSITGMTRFTFSLTDVLGTESVTYYLVTTDTTGDLWIDGLPPEGYSPVPWSDWGIQFFEGQLRLFLGPELVPFFVHDVLRGYVAGPLLLHAELSDTGTGVADQVVGWVPEPASLALLAAGAGGLLRRRRRPSRRMWSAGAEPRRGEGTALAGARAGGERSQSGVGAAALHRRGQPAKPCL